MASKDLKNNIGVVNLLEPQDLAHTDTASAWLDTLGFESAVIAVQVGALTGVDGDNYVTPVLQESDTTAAADATSVASADIEGAFTKIDSTSEDSVVQYVGYKGTKRYVRVNMDYTSTGITAGVVGIIGIVSNGREYPITAPDADAAT